MEKNLPSPPLFLLLQQRDMSIIVQRRGKRIRLNLVVSEKIMEMPYILAML